MPLASARHHIRESFESQNVTGWALEVKVPWHIYLHISRVVMVQTKLKLE